MQKKLIALAVAGLVSAPVLAQSNVTIYGVLNTSIDFTKVDGRTSATDIDSTQQISCSSCRIGFRGSEDLGNGLKAWFQLESGIDPDERSGTLASRNSAVGLAGEWGSILLGNWDTPHKRNILANVPFHATTVAGYNSILGGNSTGANPFNNRQTNSVQYWSPKIAGGLVVKAVYSTRTDASSVAANQGPLNTGEGAAGDDRVFGGNIVWDAGGLYAGLSYERQEDARLVGGTDGSEDTAWSANLSYKFAGKYRLGVIYENIEIDGFGGTTSKEDRDAYLLFALIPVGAAGTVHAQYIRGDDFSGAAGNDTGASHWSLGYYHALSKRTDVYAFYTDLDNDRNARYRLGAGPGNRLSPANGGDVSAFSLGIRHSF